MKKSQSSDYFNRLEKFLGIDEEGNITAGKNLEVDGNIFTLNGKEWGIMPVFTDINNVITDKGFFMYSRKPEIKSVTEQIKVFITKGLYFNDTGNIFVYTTNPNYSPDYVIENDILYIKSDSTYSKFVNTGLPLEHVNQDIDMLKNNKQDKLYRHILTFEASDEDAIAFKFMTVCLCGDNLKANSLQDLTTLLKPTTGFNYPIGPVVNIDTGGVKDYNYIEYSNNVWKVSSYNSGTATINITSVSDVVTLP